MTSPAHANPNTGLWKTERPMITAMALWLVTNAGQVVVGHQWLTAAQWNGNTAALIALVSGVLFTVAGWVVRNGVAPAWKLAEAEAKLAGITLPALPGVLTYEPQPIASIPLAGVPPAVPAPALDGLPVVGDSTPTGADTDPPAGTDLTGIAPPVTPAP